ncbi:PREDICTED: uncharacterized protein LOC105364885 [Ceratosolen solmsi marchali]|uniref:Uncharacterized protein LOC105364885 n=1 Tax=Ceratosolen solmsi marchali TaxID=326594 RepID=A0AAJ6YND2_9HYME|nr:PREDICTED: uncharacterized protein LOC105364885 [Ceratosolen solmsi marchali]
MKEMVIPLLCAILAVTTAKVVINIEGQDTPHLLDTKACTWGPSYWCQNITTAANCKAMKHCIPKVWEKMQVPDDNDTVCHICKNMVLEARTQLESNQTQSDLKAVFEGSCALIVFQPIVKICDNLVDEFIPELVETLSSQMDPSIVCSVAGLCNSEYIDKLLEEYKNQVEHKELKTPISLNNDEYNPNECSKCYTIMHHMKYKFKQTSRDRVLEQFLNICGELSSFSDACSSIVLTYFETIYSHLQSYFNEKNICHLSGQCSDKFHVHEDNTDKNVEVEIRPLSTVGMVEISDDLPCKLCRQLVIHLRDVLVANTTETEFQQVLLGFCKQTKSFSTECQSIVEQYYPEIYSYLTKNLNSNILCQMGGICPAPGKKSGPIWPLVPNDHAKDAEIIFNEKNAEPKILEASKMQLPIERLTPFSSLLLIDNKYCSSCEFVINFIKTNVKDLTNRDEVKAMLDEMKSTLPGFGDESNEDNFLNKYELALVELIYQGTNISEICSLIAVCPTNQQMEAWKNIPSKFIEKSTVENKPSCALCLFAVSKLYSLVEDDKTEVKIEAALDKLCHELPKNLNRECTDLVQIYSKELIELLIKDLKPREICSYIKLCDHSQSTENKQRLSIGPTDIAVPQNNLQGKEACALCEYILHYIQQAITSPEAEDEVRQVIDKICQKLPETIQNNCNDFVNAYGSALVAILAEEIDPSMICPKFGICQSSALLIAPRKMYKGKLSEIIFADKPNCPICLFGVTQLYNVIKNNKTETSIENALDKLCIHLPKSLIEQCEGFVKLYSKQLIEMIIADFTPQEVCVYLQLCDAEKNVGLTSTSFPLDKAGEIMTNEIPNYPLHTKQTAIMKIECDLCEFMTERIKDMINSHKSKEKIGNMFNVVCNNLPTHILQKCNHFIEKYADIVLELVAKKISTKRICTSINLCVPDTTTLRESVAECAFCQEVISNVEILIDDRKTNGNTEEIIVNVCKHVTTSDKEKCIRLIEKNKKSIIRIIKSHGDTAKICSKLSYCASHDFLLMLIKNGRTRRQADDKNLGTKPCTWGISYWCVDDKTAEECKATELCKKKGRLPESTSTTVKATSDNREVASEAEQAVSEDARSSSS